MKLTPFIVAAVMAVSAPAGAQTVDRIETPRHTQIEVLRDYPAGKGPFPVLILGPGMGYHARLPILKSVAKAGVADGFVVYRLNWSFWLADPKNGKPTENRQGELEDFQTAVDLALKDPAVDTSRVIFGGKSLGSFIAWRALQQDTRARAAIELTPLCSDFKPPVTFESDYPALDTEKRPSLWVLGDADKACAVPTLYGKLQGAGGPTHLLVLSGNHSLETGTPVDAAATDRSIAAATAVVSDFLVKQIR